MPTSDEEWERVAAKAGKGSSLASTPLGALKRFADNMKKEWDMDGRSKVDEIARAAKQKLSRLDVVATLRRYANMSAPPGVQGPGSKLPREGGSGEGAMPSWWEAGKDDLSLVRGVLSHGFGKWKPIFADKALFPRGVAAEAIPTKMALLKRLKVICNAAAPPPPSKGAPKPQPKAPSRPPPPPPLAVATAATVAKEAAARAAAAKEVAKAAAAKEAATAAKEAAKAAARAAAAEAKEAATKPDRGPAGGQGPGGQVSGGKSSSDAGASPPAGVSKPIPPKSARPATAAKAAVGSSTGASGPAAASSTAVAAQVAAAASDSDGDDVPLAKRQHID